MVILGRQIQNWSKLYQEIFEGISAQCCALGCPLLFLSSDKLVRQQSPERPPKFATRSTQLRELQALTTTMPRLSAGILLDHLWDEELLQTATPPQVQRIMLARRTTSGSLISSAPDFGAGARLLLDHLIQSGCGQIYLGIPFTGDQAVEAANDAVRSEACARGFPVIATLDCSTAAKRHASIARLARCDRDCAVVCSEDNVTALMWHELVEIRPRLKHIRLAAMQGTSALELPIPRLRFDYHQLGRNAVMAAIGQRRDHHLLAPKLIIP